MSNPQATSRPDPSRADPRRPGIRARAMIKEYAHAIALLEAGADATEIGRAIVDTSMHVSFWEASRAFNGEEVNREAAARGVYAWLDVLSRWSRQPAIFTFDEALERELVVQGMPKIKQIPCEALQHLPFRVVAVEVEGKILFASIVEAWWVRDKFVLLVIENDHTGRLVFNAMPLVHSLEGSINVALKSSARYARGAVVPIILEIARRVLPVLLYLASKEPDITRHPSGDTPPRKTRKGRRARPLRVEAWRVGARIGATLRGVREVTQRDGEGGEERRGPRPHLRRAHWHLYWTGKGRTVPRVKWVAPTIVNATSAPLPTEVRPVEVRT